jgi:uncharacterized phage protein (TIGR02218 family)
MRSISAALLTHLQGATLTLATLVKVTRQDGVSLGFTSADVNITFGGTTYQASSAVDASALRGQLASGIDNVQLMGVLKSSALTDTDLLAGLYDGASITISLVNFNDLTMGAMTLLTGFLGDTTLSDGQYTIEVRSLSQLTGQQIGELTSPSCRVLQFGDERCSRAGGNVLPGGTNFQETLTVATVISDVRLNFGASVNPTTFYAYGVVRFTSGANAGIAREIQSQVSSPGNAVVNLQEAFPFTVQVGDVAVLTAGCDRTESACRTKFNNLINMRAEPGIPGTDQILRVGRR